MLTAVPLPSERRWLVLLAVCVAGLILPLEYTGPAMALIAIQAELGGTPVALAWVVNAFALGFGCLVMAAGSLADQWGRKKVFCAGLAAFVFLSAAASMADGVVLLDVLRGAQGIAAALTMAGGSASLAQEFHGHERTKAYSLLGTAFGLGLASGPVLAGLMVDTLGWRSIFWLGSVFGTLALLIALPTMRDTRDPDAALLDLRGLITFTVSLLLFTTAIMRLTGSEVSELETCSTLMLAIAVFVLFIGLERNHQRPMLDLSLFGDWRFVGVQLLPIATAVCFIVLLIVLPIRLIAAQNMPAIEAGTLMIALCGPMMIIPYGASVLSRHAPATLICCVGLLIAAAALAWLATVPTEASWYRFAAPMVVIGIGAGLPWGLMDDLSISVVPLERSGMATGIFTTMRACGEAICVAGALAIFSTIIGLELSADGFSKTSSTLPAQMAMGKLNDAQDAEIFSRAFSTLLYVLSATTFVLGVICLAAFAYTDKRVKNHPHKVIRKYGKAEHADRAHYEQK